MGGQTEAVAISDLIQGKGTGDWKIMKLGVVINERRSSRERGGGNSASFASPSTVRPMYGNLHLRPLISLGLSNILILTVYLRYYPYEGGNVTFPLMFG